jgi:predicted enzyme related to lactoylglutathione lyase
MHSLSMDKLISWFEIPALDLNRARAFYEQILGIALREEQFGPNRLAVFPYNRELHTGGCVIKGDGYNPSQDGAVLYLNAGDSLDSVLARVAPAGGRIATPKTALPPGMGAFAHIVDTEGNRVGLHGAS